MIRRFKASHYNLNIINLSDVYRENIDISLINDLHKYDLLDKSINSSIRQLFYYHVIYGICRSITANSAGNNLVFFFNFSELVDTEIVKYFDRDKMQNLFKQTLQALEQMLPIIIYTSTYIEFDQLHTKFTDDMMDIMHNMIQLVESRKDKNFTFEKILKFTKKHKLTFLNTNYFNQIKTKVLLLT